METEEEEIRRIRCIQLNSERVYELKGRLFAEASGDGMIGAMAGAKFMMGSEGRGEFGESLAPEHRTSVTNGDTVMFHTAEMKTPQPFRRLPHLRARATPSAAGTERRLAAMPGTLLPTP